ncbi:hypothetical protein EJB05_57844, partial [Eragrostis curvula]
MATQQHHLLLAVVVLSASVLHAAAAASNWTVYDFLAENSLPRGLLPQGVQSYEVHVGGALNVTLPGEVCTVSVAADGKTYRFRYGRCVGGVLDVNPSAITRTYGITMELGDGRETVEAGRLPRFPHQKRQV